MSHTNERAERLISEAEAGAVDHGRRMNYSSTDVDLYQIKLLEGLIRNLCAEAAGLRAAVEGLKEHAAHQRDTIAAQGLTITRQRNQLREQTEKLNELTFRLCDDNVEADSEDLRRRIAAFTRSTGAAAALRGGVA